EHFLEEGFMRGAGDNGDLFALNQLGQHISHRAVDTGDEASRRTVIGIGEIAAPACRRRYGDGCDDGVASIIIECIEQQIESARLNGAGRFDFIAELPRKIDIESGRIAIWPSKIERRIIELGKKADGLDT